MISNNEYNLGVSSSDDMSVIKVAFKKVSI